MADPLEEARALLGAKDERDEVKSVQDYLFRLNRFLNTLVQKKVITPDKAVSFLEETQKKLTSFDWEADIAAQETGVSRLAAAPFYNLLRYNDAAAKEQLTMFINNTAYTQQLAEEKATTEATTAEIARLSKLETEAVGFYGGQQQKQLNEAYWLSQTQQFAGASGFTVDMEEEPRELAGLPSGLPLYEEALKGLPSQMAGYFAGRPEEVITDEIQSARMQWWQTLQASQQPDPLEQNILRGRERIATLKQMLASTRTPQTMEAPFPEAPTAGTTSGYKEAQAGLARSISTLEAQSAQDIAQSVGRIGNIPERPTGVDPLTEYLEKYPFTSEYMKLTARQRGAYSYRFRPPTRWY